MLLRPCPEVVCIVMPSTWIMLSVKESFHHTVGVWGGEVGKERERGFLVQERSQMYSSNVKEGGVGREEGRKEREEELNSLTLFSVTQRRFHAREAIQGLDITQYDG